MKNSGKYKFIFVGKSGKYYSINDLCNHLNIGQTALVNRLRKYGIIPKTSDRSSKMLIEIDAKLANILKAAKTKNAFDERFNMCIDCVNCIGGCSWSMDFIPVEGWEAIPEGISYRIISCPEFESEYKLAIDIDKLEKEALDSLLMSVFRSACREYRAAAESHNKTRLKRAERFFKEDGFLSFKEIGDYFNFPEVDIDHFLELLEDQDPRNFTNGFMRKKHA